MNLEKIKYVYLLGAGGIGMSALGRYFIKLGISVSGYDKTSTNFTNELQAEGFDLNFSDLIENIPFDVRNSSKEDLLVIHTPAVPSNNKQYNYLKDKGFKIHKRAEVLGLISSRHKTIAVAGTHGKTTTSSLIAHLFYTAGLNPVAFLGGIAANYGTNFLAGGHQSIMIAEADEFDRSFLHLHPSTAIVTSVDPDHLDIYGEEKELLKTFNDFVNLTPADGNIIIKAGLPFPQSIKERAISYHTSAPADIQLIHCKEESGYYHFGVRFKNQTIDNLKLGQPGFHNVENALAAIGAALVNGIVEEALRTGLSSFKGVKRRFEYIIRTDDLIFIDDYAHHPEELNACIRSVRALYPDKKITGVFQPHLFSRTRDFYDDFALSLSLLDQVILLDIYPAREEPIPGVSSDILLEKIKLKERFLVAKESLPEFLLNQNPQVLLTLGAGDIDQLVEPIRKKLTFKSN